MSSTPSRVLSQITLELQAYGAASARALAEETGLSQPTISRALAGLGSKIERIGASVNTRYALRRAVRNFGDRWSLYRIDEQSRALRWGELRALHGGFRFVPEGSAARWLVGEFADGLFPGLPFFFQDVRPQGYLGRAIGRSVADLLTVGADPRNWSDDDLLAYLYTAGADLPGNLVLGDRAMEAALRAQVNSGGDAIPESNRAELYPEHAAQAQRGEVAGSSAGGEQPKFLAMVRRSSGNLEPVIVKFSPADDSPSGLRWRDLLLCEFIAGQLLARHGIESAATQLLDYGGRRFLEVVRFDRVGGAGRRGMIALGTILETFLERASPDERWTAAAGDLEREGWLTAASARELRWRWCFGNLIGNSDMHRSNTSLWLGDAVPFSLTPSYDMLPMLFAPGPQGELTPRQLEPLPPLPALEAIWSDASRVALEFWQTVVDEPRVSDNFRALARSAGERVAALRLRFG